MAGQPNGLAEFLTSTVAAEFTPVPYWEPETDSLIFYFRNEPSYSKRLNQLMTIFLSAADDKLVGCEVKGIKRILKRVKQFGIGISDHKLDLKLVLFAALVPEPESPSFEDEYPDDFADLLHAASETE